MRPPPRFQGIMGGDLAAQLIPALEEIKYRAEPQVSDTGEVLPKGLYLQRDPNYEYGDLVPMRKNILTGEKSFALPGIMGGAVKAAQAPGRAARGENVPPEDAVEVGMNLLGGNQVITRGAVPAPGEMFAFGGKKGLRNLVDAGKRTRGTEEEFERWQFATRRPTPEEADKLWEEVGVDAGFRYDGPRIEVGRDIKFTTDPKQATIDVPVPAESVLSNFDELKIAYPEFKDLKIKFVHGTGGAFQPGTKTIEVGVGGTPDEALSTLHHEIEHFVQEQENFARGTNSLMSHPPAEERMPAGADFMTSDSLKRGILGKAADLLPPESQGILRGVAQEDWSRVLEAVARGHDHTAAGYIKLDKLGITPRLGERTDIKLKLVQQIRKDLEASGVVKDLWDVDPYMGGLSSEEQKAMKEILFQSTSDDVYAKAAGENNARLAGVRSHLEQSPTLPSRPSATFPDAGSPPLEVKVPGDKSFRVNEIYPQSETYHIPKDGKTIDWDHNWNAFKAQNPEYMKNYESMKVRAKALADQFRGLAAKYGVELK